LRPRPFGVGDAQYDFCRARQSCEAERAGTKRHQNLLSFQPFPAYRIAGCSERDAYYPRGEPNSATAVAGSDCGARHARSDGTGAEAGGRSRQAKPEVLIEVAVMQVSRSKMHTLGVSPPTSVTVALQNNVNTARPLGPLDHRHDHNFFVITTAST